MMKRLSLLLLTFAAVLSMQAEHFTASITCTDGNVQNFYAGTYNYGELESATFSSDASTVYLHFSDGVTVSYPVDYINSIAFLESEESEISHPYTTDFDVAFSDDDETSYSSVTEKVTTKETDADYGDFVENYEDDDESKGTVTITWNGATASVAYNPSSLKNSIVLASGTSSDVVIYGSKKVDYVLKGSTTDGSLTLYSEKKCKLELSGVSITNADGAAINMPKKTMGTTSYGGKTCYVVLSGTSSLTDGTTYSSAVSGEDMKATLFSEGQLIFSGSGTLNITSRYGHGIASDDYIRVRGGKHNPVITVNSVKDGISVNDYLLMYGGTVTVTAADDGIDVGKGYVAIKGGKLTVNATDEGIAASYQGESNGTVDATITPTVYIDGGLVTVTTTGDKGHAIRARKDIRVTGGIVRTTVKGAGSKGLNADGVVSITGGKVIGLVDGLPVYDEEENDFSSATGIRSKGNLVVENAVLGIKATAAGGKGINATGDITLTGSDVTIVTLGSKYTSDGSTSRARGITTDADCNVHNSNLAFNRLRVRSVDDAIYTLATLSVIGSNVQAFSTDGKALHYARFDFLDCWLAYN